MKLPLLSHLDELRSRIIKISLFFLVFFIVTFVFSNKIIFFLQNSILEGVINYSEDKL
ncbi:twin-arginine translocase subunit TatC [Patescibacteria group bacterium]|nr:twin-arginine translocase subunit TatC [Patescibacteria group bacterium]